MKLSSLYRGKHTFPIIVFLITITCCIVSIPTYFDTNLFDLFAWWSQPNHFWQIFSGAFEHGIYPQWFLWVHFLSNMLMVIPLGLIVERFLKIKGTSILFLASWIIPSIIYQVALRNIHAAGLVIGFIVLLLFKTQIDRNFTAFIANKETKDRIAAPYYGFFLLPLFFVLILLLYYCKIIYI